MFFCHQSVLWLIFVTYAISLRYTYHLSHQLQFSSFQSLSCVQLFATPWIAARQASLSITNSHPSSQRCHPAISSSVVPFSSCPQSLPASESFPMSQLFTWGGQSTGASALASFLPKIPGLIFRMGWLALLAVQGTRKSLLQHHSSKASILRRSAFFIVQLSHPYMTTWHWSLEEVEVIAKTWSLVTFIYKFDFLVYSRKLTAWAHISPNSNHFLVNVWHV